MIFRPRTPLLVSAGLAYAIALSSGAVAEVDPRSLTPEMTPMAEVEAPESTLAIDAWINRADGLYMPGETVSLTLRATEDAWLTVLATDAQGRSTVVFPNTLHTNSFVSANSLMNVPGPDANWQLTVNPPFGANMLTVIATSTEVDLLSGLTVAAVGPFRSIDDDAENLARHLSVEMAAKPEARWSSTRIDFAVVPSRGEAQPFALTLETSQPSYRIGEAVNLRLQSEQECSLVLVNVNEAQNEAVVIYPNQVVPDLRLPAGETVRLPGPDASVQLQALGPAGPQTMIARCEADGSQTLAQFSAATSRGVYPVLTLDEWSQITTPPSVSEVRVAYSVLP